MESTSSLAVSLKVFFLKKNLVGVYKKKIVGVFLEKFSLRKKKGIDVEIEYGRCKAVSNIRHAHETQEKKRKKRGSGGDGCGDGVWALQD